MTCESPDCTEPAAFIVRIGDETYYACEDCAIAAHNDNPALTSVTDL